MLNKILKKQQKYLINLQKWNEFLAIKIAYSEGIELTESHWKIIYILRKFYKKYKTFPSVRMLIKIFLEKNREKKIDSRYLFHLFPKGPLKQATKIAGLPKSVNCL